MTAPTMTVSELQARVDRGVVWLDEHIPDWWRTDRPSQGFDQGGAIDLGELRMKDPCWCVLGQLIGNYYRTEIPLDEAVAFGFDVESCTRPEMADEFDALTELWTRVIEQRRAEVTGRG
ncbi:hypothetical protein [Micromonospora tarensis]|uniref:Uncharacterized protein n=1 Tax=Micromonospora tarensis TaxID=2806100 RepID=A0ABS1YCK0_9ACTN|nr:hypothetical protein [Micromonospora tarensis]MBM0275125.1 hypothetical protein [Micromonospora tarensis]